MPTLRHKHPTARQIECFILVHVRGLTQSEAALSLGITQPTVAAALKLLYKQRPELGEVLVNIEPPEMLTYAPSMDCRIVQKF